MKNNDYQLVFDYLPGIYLIVKPNAPHFSIIGFNKAYADTTQSDASIIGKNLFEEFNDNANHPLKTEAENVRNSLMTVIQTKQPHTMGLLLYDLWNAKTQQFEERYWQPVNIPVLDKENILISIIHSVTDVTEKVMVEEKSNKAQQELQHLDPEPVRILESTENAFIYTDKSWAVKYWNKQAEIIFNIKHREISDKYLWDFINKSHSKNLYEYLHKAKQENRPICFEEHFSIPDAWMQVNAYPVEQGLVIFMINVTKKEKAGEEQQSDKRRIIAMIENISDGLVIISRDGIVQDISVSGRKMLGTFYSNIIIGKNYKTLVFSADLPRIQQAFEHALQYESIHAPRSTAFQNSSNDAIRRNEESVGGGLITFRGAMLIERKLMWFEGSFHNLLHDEAVNAIVLTFRNITKRREQEIKLRSSEEKYRSLFQNNPASIIIWSLDDFNIQEVNKTAINLFGYSYPHFLNTSIFDIALKEEHDRIHTTAEKLKTGNSINTGIYKCKTRQGNTIYVTTSFHKIIYGGQAAVLTLGTDVTEQINLQKKLEEEQTKRQQQITEAALTAQENERAELGKELHDNINQILTTTRLYIEHALTKQGKQDELLKYSKEYITKAIQEIRQLSRRLMPPSLEESSLKQELEELFSSLKFIKNYKFKFEFLLMDEERISKELKLAIFRIIQEGLNNIFKHAKATEVIVRIERKEGTLEICMEDNGIGFNPKKRTPGLGLHNISNRAGLFKGQVVLNSQAGKGTKLKIIFPVR